ncbi:MAG: hypothetical protein WCR54_02765 [Clostridia bacterium]
MKKLVKIIVVFMVLVVSIVALFSYNKSKDYYAEYFNDFSSNVAITKAESKLNLSPTVSVYSYDAVNELFITKKAITNEYYQNDNDKILFLFGFASINEEYQSPVFSHVISIKGDYAIVTKPIVSYDEDLEKNVLINIIGVVKFRGANKGDKTDFTNEYCKYNEAFSQFLFLGDYIVCPNSKVFPNYMVNYSTFYSYIEKDKLFEEFKVACGSQYDLKVYDNILVSTYKGYAYFYSLDSMAQNGYLQKTEYDTYKAFPEDVNDDYADSIEIQINYLGNGLFVRTSKITSENIFEGYNVIFEDYDSTTSTATTMYGRVKSDLYNYNSKMTNNYDWLLVDSVANKYTIEAYQNTVDILNNKIIADSVNDRYQYYLPMLNPATFVKNNYSIIYFYYFPDMDKGDFNYKISFCLIDEDGQIVRINDLLMPPKFTDGKGLQNVDPTYESLLGNLQYTTYNNELVDLLKIEDGDNCTYETCYLQSDAIIAIKYDFTNLTKYYGAIDVSTGRQITDFKYIEMTPFYDEYAIGVVAKNGVYTNYLINRNGEETLINDMVNIRQGVYVYASQVGKMGLKNYAGDILINAVYDNLEVVESFDYEGKQTSYAVATSNSNTYIYALT